MLERFKNHIDKYFSFLKGSPFLIAISGGVDSVVLTHLFHSLGYNFSLCHCNFKLRDSASEDDEFFVKDLGNNLSKKVYTASFDTENYALENKLSIQVAARNLRYQWFGSLMDEKGYKFLLTAHNTNDNLETFLINLTRGSGLEGFTGIPMMNGRFIRPLLGFSRAEIESYALGKNIEWREDESNQETKYLRNKIRHQITPVLEEINPALLHTFQNTIQNLKESQLMIDDRINEVRKEVVTQKLDVLSVNIEKLKEYGNSKPYLYQLLKPYGFKEWNDVVGLLSAQSGKQLFSNKYRLLKDRNELLIVEKKAKIADNEVVKIVDSNTSIETPIKLVLSKGDLNLNSNKNSILADLDLLKFPLFLRKWKHGDFFYPTGMKGKKKVSQLFKDKKVTLIDKENTWLLTTADDQIVWVIGLRYDRRFAASSTTKNTLTIST